MYVINLTDNQSNGTHCVSSFFDKNAAFPFDSLLIEYIPQEVLSKMKSKSITHKIFGIQDDDSIMCGFCCIAFIKYMIARKLFLDYVIYEKQLWQGFILKKIDESRNYLLEEIRHNDLINEKHKIRV